MTVQDVQGLIALAIVSNKNAFIQAMRSNGVAVPAGISNDDLYTLANDTWAKKGPAVMLNILNASPINKSLLTSDQQTALIRKFGLSTDPLAKCGFSDPLSCITSPINYVGDLLGGHGSSVTVLPTSTTTSTSPLSPTMLALIVVIGIILMVIFRKFTALVVGIVVVIFAVVLYGIFAKQISAIITGGTTTGETHGGIGAAIASALAHLFVP